MLLFQAPVIGADLIINGLLIGAIFALAAYGIADRLDLLEWWVARLPQNVVDDSGRSADRVQSDIQSGS